MRILFESVRATNEHRNEIEARKIFGMDVDFNTVYTVIVRDNDAAYDYFEKIDPERTNWSTDDSGVVYFISKEGKIMQS